MGSGSLNFKYWIEFSEEGEIKAFHKNKYDCENPCNEYIVKLIPIQRNIAEDLEKSANNLSKTIQQETKKLDTEFKKTLKGLKGVLK